MNSKIIEEFIIALEQEITAVKKGDKGGSIVKVFNGRFLREVSGLFVYIFNLENFLAVLDDSPAEIEIRGNRYPAQVLLTQGLEVEIGIERFCGQHIAEGKIQTKLWYLLELLKKKFVELQDGTSNISFSEALFNSQLDKKTDFDNIVSCGHCGTKNRIAKRAPAQTPICSKCAQEIEPSYSSSTNPPNDHQERAIRSSFFSRLAVIWGPPGTGKTRTIAQAIEAHLNAGRRVLLVSHANAAVDEALEDVAKQLKNTPFYSEGKLVRLGIPQSGHLEKLTEKYPLVLLDNIVFKLGESLRTEKIKLETEKDRIESALKQFDKAFHLIQLFRILSSELGAERTELSDLNKKVPVLKAEIKRLEQDRRLNRNKLIQAKSAGAVRRFFRGLDPLKIQQEIDKISLEVDAKKQQENEMGGRINSLKQLIAAKELEATEARGEIGNAVSRLGITEEQLIKKRKDAESQRDAIISRITEIVRELDEIQKKALSEARLVATTLTKTFVAKQFPDTPFDVLILDEASMAPLPHLYWAVSRCRGYITIVGDFLQLPPICISAEAMARKWLGRSIFDVLGINSIQEADKDKRVKLLDTQYRMVPEISLIPNRLIYQNKLRDDLSTSNRSFHDGVSKLPLVLVETASANPWCSRLSAGGRFNLYNALLSCTLAKKIIPKISDSGIGIITPYAAQARLISKIATDWGIRDSIRPSTVHRFQGGEESVIIFDTVEGSGTKVAPMLDDKKPDSDAMRLLNVAITRARNRFYLLGHTKHLLSDLHPDSVLSWIVHHFFSNAEKISSEDLVDSYFTSDFEKWADASLSIMTNDEPNSGQLFTEKNFWAQFFQDLKASKARLVLLSPFLSVRRSGFFMDYFRAMKERGVDIRVYTRPRNQQTGEMANQADIVIDQLHSIDIRVIEKSRMHQKVAIIDDAIAWEGSLNILSHKDTEEHMRRFEGISTVEEIVRNLELDEEMPAGYQTEEECPKGCGGYLVVRTKFGRKFLGCSNYARKQCRYTRRI
jgi:superfamily I DNA and/or RNA helicase